MRNLMVKAYAWAEARKAREEGQTAIEYAVVLGTVVVALIAALLLLSPGPIDDAITKVNGMIT